MLLVFFKTHLKGNIRIKQLISQLKKGGNMKKPINNKVSIAKTTRATQVHNHSHKRKNI